MPRRANPHSWHFLLVPGMQNGRRAETIWELQQDIEVCLDDDQVASDAWQQRPAERERSPSDMGEDVLAEAIKQAKEASLAPASKVAKTLYSGRHRTAKYHRTLKCQFMLSGALLELSFCM